MVMRSCQGGASLGGDSSSSPKVNFVPRCSAVSPKSFLSLSAWALDRGYSSIPPGLRSSSTYPAVHWRAKWACSGEAKNASVAETDAAGWDMIWSTKRYCQCYGAGEIECLINLVDEFQVWESTDALMGSA